MHNAKQCRSAAQFKRSDISVRPVLPARRQSPRSFSPHCRQPDKERPFSRQCPARTSLTAADTVCRQPGWGSTRDGSVDGGDTDHRAPTPLHRARASRPPHHIPIHSATVSGRYPFQQSSHYPRSHPHTRATFPACFTPALLFQRGALSIPSSLSVSPRLLQ